MIAPFIFYFVLSLGPVKSKKLQRVLDWYFNKKKPNWCSLFNSGVKDSIAQRFINKVIFPLKWRLNWEKNRFISKHCKKSILLNEEKYLNLFLITRIAKHTLHSFSYWDSDRWMNRAIRDLWNFSCTLFAFDLWMAQILFHVPFKHIFSCLWSHRRRTWIHVSFRWSKHIPFHCDQNAKLNQMRKHCCSAQYRNERHHIRLKR